MIITLQHLRTVPAWNNKKGLCAIKARVFCKQHGLNWSDFIKYGIEEQKLLATNNAMAKHVVNYAHQVGDL